MRFSKVHRSTLGAFVFLAAGCGLLGKNEAINRAMSYADSGMACLDGFSEKLAQYKEGAIADSEWKSSMECVNSNLKTFQQFVAPSSPDGYSISEMQLFVSKFLLTTAPVSESVIRGIFELKAALLGGSTERISPVELNKLLENLDQIKNISLDVLQALRGVQDDPTDEKWIRLSTIAREAGERLAALLPSEAYASLSLQAVQSFVQEARSFGIDLDPALANAALAIKVLLVGGSNSQIEPDSWREFARLIGRVIGPWAILSQGQKAGGRAFYERRAVFTELLRQGSQVITSSMAHHGGAWPLTLLDRVIDSLPAAWLPVRASVMKSTLRPLAQKIFASRTRDAFDANTVNTITTTLDDWSRGATHINRIFDIIGRNSVSWSELISYTQSYRDTQSQSLAKADASRILALVQLYQPFMSEGDGMIRLSRGQFYSKTQLHQVHWTNLAAKRFMKAYSAPRGDGTVSETDLANFFSDFMDFASDVHYLDPTTIDMPGKRFRDMDLFTPASDGNGSLGETEITYFLSYVISIGNLSDRIAKAVIPRCPQGAADIFGTYFVTKDCFVSNYFGQHQTLWDHFPHLVEYFSAVSPSSRKKVESDIELSARRYGITDLPVGGIDIQGYAGLLHYAETIMARFDRDENGILNVDEVLAAYPVFKRILAKTGNLDINNDTLIQAVLTYIVKYQEIPKQDLKFITWFLSRPFWKLDADRGGLFNLISKISAPEPVPANLKQ